MMKRVVMCVVIMVVLITFFSGCTSEEKSVSSQNIPVESTQKEINVTSTGVPSPSVTISSEPSPVNNHLFCGDKAYDTTTECCCSGRIITGTVADCSKILENPKTYDCASVKEKKGTFYSVFSCSKSDGISHGYRVLTMSDGGGGAQVLSGFIVNAIFQIQNETASFQDLKGKEEQIDIIYPISMSYGKIDVPMMRGAEWKGDVNMSIYQPIDTWYVDSMKWTYDDGGRELSIAGENIRILPANTTGEEYTFSIGGVPPYTTVLIPDYEMIFGKLEVNDNGTIITHNDVSYSIQSSDLDMYQKMLQATDKTTGLLYVSPGIDKIYTLNSGFNNTSPQS